MFRIELTPEAADDLESLHPRRKVRAVKTIDLAQAQPDVARLLEQARSEDLLVRLADGTEFLLVAIDEFDQEIARTRQNPRLMALLEARARQSPTVPLDEVKGRLGL
jgi:hypothetical protein